jgi:hypothetical protein
MEPRAALVGLAAGAVVLAVLFAGPASRRRLRGEEPLPVPSDACYYDPWWVAGARSLYPSTVGVTAMSVIALSRVALGLECSPEYSPLWVYSHSRRG